jgi:hypothetical protein
VIVRSAVLSDMIAAPEVKVMGGRAAHRPMVDTQVLAPFTRAGCWHRVLVGLVGGDGAIFTVAVNGSRVVGLAQEPRTTGDTQCHFTSCPLRSSSVDEISSAFMK